MSCLYVTEHGASVGIRQNRVEVKYQNGSLKSIPIEPLESIEIFGRSQMTTQAIAECLSRGIPVSFYAHGGEYFGRLVNTDSVNVSRQRLQFAMTEDDAFRLALAKRILEAKIHNQCVLLRRYARSSEKNVSAEIAILSRTEKRADRCESMEELMGCEGFAARQYFQGLGKLVKEEFHFEKRSKRPLKDEFNALISFGYSLLFHEIHAKAENRGLNAYLGFIHEDKEKHPALISDLVEEWRAVIVDAAAMSLINGNEIQKEHFQKTDTGVYLNKGGSKIFINKMEQKMRKEMRYLDYADYPVTFRRALDMQIMRLVKAMEEKDPELYHPVRTR